MKNPGHGTNDCWLSGGTHAEEIARARSPDCGHSMKKTRYCARCNAERPAKGGTRKGGIFACALHGAKVAA